MQRGGWCRQKRKQAQRIAARGRGGRPSRLQSAQLSDRILDVATALFLGHGFGTTSIEAVAKRAGISEAHLLSSLPRQGGAVRGRGAAADRAMDAAVRRRSARCAEPRRDACGAPPKHMLDVALTPEALALHRMAIAEARQFPGLARILHEFGAPSGVERIRAASRTARRRRRNRPLEHAVCRRAIHHDGGDRSAAARAWPRRAARHGRTGRPGSSKRSRFSSTDAACG